MENDLYNLMAKSLSGEITPEEQLIMEKWISEHEANQQAWEEAKEAWRQANFDTAMFSLQKGKQLLEMKLQGSEKPLHAARKRILPLWWRVAAVVLLLMTTGGYLAWQQSQSAAMVWLEKEIPFGQKATITLADGSKVKLNAGAALRYPEQFGETKREVFLQGEAFFVVAHDPARPFTVLTGQIRTTVLGTSFNVAAYPQEKVTVSLSTGKVKVEKPGWEAVLLQPGQQAAEKINGFETTPFDPAQVLAWKDSTLIFDKTPLMEVARKLERWYGVTIEFANPGISRCQLTGKFKNETLMNILESIKYTSDVEYEITDKQVRLSGKGCD